MNNVFVYGTLKAGGMFDRSWNFHQSRINVIPGTVNGIMFNVNGCFPGVVLRENEGAVYGEVHTYKPEDMPKVLEKLDFIESEGKLYNRIKTKIHTANGNVDAYMYEFACNTENLDRVVEGRW